LAACCAFPVFGEQQYVIGITVVQPAPTCPVFVTEVDKHSPAEKAGVLAGDRLDAIDGVAVLRGADAKRLRADSPKSSVLEILRNGEHEHLKISRESQGVLMKKRHLHRIGEEWFPKEITKEDVAYRRRLDRLLSEPKNIIGTAFSADHYPKDLSVYYPGFEVFITRNPGAVVGGIEAGPASRAGIRYGDIILSVDGTPISGQTPEAAEHLLSSDKPRQISLLVERLSKTKVFHFELERADRILSQNGWQIVHGEKFPAAINPMELDCAFPESSRRLRN
jgi:C-terminal processing protease CtpA/Prc